MNNLRPTIHNIVGKSDCKILLPLPKIAEYLKEVEYEPEQYFALIFRCQSPAVSVLANTSGKLVIVGGKSLRDLEAGRDRFINELRKLGLDPQSGPVHIQNVVASFRLPNELDIEAIQNLVPSEKVAKMQKGTTSLMVRLRAPPRGTLLFYRTGAVLICGAKSDTDLDGAFAFALALAQQAGPRAGSGKLDKREVEQRIAVPSSPNQ